MFGFDKEVLDDFGQMIRHLEVIGEALARIADAIEREQGDGLQESEDQE